MLKFSSFVASKTLLDFPQKKGSQGGLCLKKEKKFSTLSTRFSSRFSRIMGKIRRKGCCFYIRKMGILCGVSGKQARINLQIVY